MAIKLNVDQGKPVRPEKPKKTKLEKARLILLIFSILSFLILLLYAIVCFNPAIFVLPVFFLWFLVVAIPTICSIGTIWAIEGYRSFASDMTNILGESITKIERAFEITQISLPYVSSITLAVIASYVVVSAFNFKKDTKNTKNLVHLVISGVMLILGILFVVLSAVFLKKISA